MKYQRLLFLSLLFLGGLTACDSAATSAETAEPAAAEAAPAAPGPKRIEIEQVTLPLDDSPNPAAPGFDAAGSDARAVAIADSIVKYHGGRTAWDDTRHLRWNFLGRRTLHWDKHAQRVRIDEPGRNTVYLLDYSGPEPAGRVRRLGDEVTDPDSLAFYLQRANGIFINDSYWLVHQFKLKDTGVTLKYVDEVRTDPMNNRPSYILDQTFTDVGNTPGNRYRLYVDKANYRINVWEFYRNAADEKPALVTPWLEYYPYRGLLLSGDRGEGFQLSDIAVLDQVKDRMYTEF